MKKVILLLLFAAQFSWAGSWVIKDSLQASLVKIWFADNNNGWILTESDTLFHTTDGGQTWNVQTYGSDYAINTMQFVDAQTGWLMGDVGMILKTTNGGQTWQEQNSGVYDLIVAMDFIDANHGWAVGENGLILKTVDGGQIWQEQHLPTDTTKNQAVYFIDAQTGWIVGAQGEYGFVMKTTDGGATWNVVFQDTTYRPFRSVYFTDDQNGWIGGMGGVILHTSDGGLTWVKQRQGDDKEQIRYMCFLDSTTGWATGVKNYLLFTEDGGANWYLAGLPVNKKIMSLYFTDDEHGWAITSAGNDGSKGGKGGEEGEDKIVEASDSTSAYAYILTYSPESTAIEENPMDLPVKSFELLQNFPNPFNPVTKIRYQIASPGIVRLDVFNVLGQHIRTLVNQYQHSGKYAITFNAGDLPSGIYFYRLQTPTFSAIKQMILLK